MTKDEIVRQYKYTPPKPAGFWVLSNSLKVTVQKKPDWFRRAVIRLVFGWKWEDYVDRNGYGDW